MNKQLLGVVMGICLVIAMPAQAVHLANSGGGQVLLFPYYTVNSYNQSLISIVNSTDRGKATRLLFREGRNSRLVMELSIYLAPYDVWTGAVFDIQEGGPANLSTRDDSCTVPALRTSASLPELPNGVRYAPFSNAAYTGSADDAGPDDLARTREGHFELIEMGEVTNASFATLDAITHQADAPPPGCLQLIQAWEPGGYWHTSLNADLTPPGGGLYGTIYLVDALNGTMQAVAADAIAGFSKHVLNAPPGQGIPTLAWANEEGFGEVIFATVFDQGAPVVLEYPRERAIDAVSAVLMADRIHNDFVTGANVGGASEWVVTFPTKHFYTDVPGAVAIPPFTSVFSGGIGAGVEAGALADIEIDAWNRQGIKLDCIPPHDYRGCIIGVPPPQPPLALSWASNVINFNRELQQPEPSPILGSQLNFDIYLFDIFDGGTHADGAFRMSFWEQEQGSIAGHLMRPDNRGRRMRGLPVQGFWVASYTNGQLTPGVLSNYSDAVRHQGSVSITPAAQ